MKVGVLIPTRNDRPEFCKQALDMILAQTMLPDAVLLSDHKTNLQTDLTQRYRIGYLALSKLCDLIICWEDDDYYSPEYIEKIVTAWQVNKPDLIGYDNTTYYHIVSQKYREMTHSHSSMFKTAIKAGLEIDWPEDTHVWLDTWLWNRHKGPKELLTEKHTAIGIKHGKGAGKGHIQNGAIYKNNDKNFAYLADKIDSKSLNFYKEWTSTK